MNRTLSARRQQVLELVQQGLPNKEIARRLGIALRTVTKHLSDIFKVMGVSKRSQLIALGKTYDPRVEGLLDALRAIAAHKPYPALIASRALKDYGESL